MAFQTTAARIPLVIDGTAPGDLVRKSGSD